MTTNWKEVSRQNPCPVCHKTHWCAVTTGAVLCMRVPSNHPKLFKTGETGWIHKDGTVVVPQMKRAKPSPEVNCDELLFHWSRHTAPFMLHALADSLKVAASSLMDLGACWAPKDKAWAFPMRNGDGKVVGIRLRNTEGQKWAVTGSHQGLFYPLFKAHPDTIWLVEGPTDTAAGLTIGLFAIGRPSCSGGVQDARTYCRRLGVRRAVIVSDNDGPGLTGAQMLQRHLPIPSTLLLLPAKDMRNYVQAGGTAELLDAEIENSIWRKPHGQS